MSQEPTFPSDAFEKKAPPAAAAAPPEPEDAGSAAGGGYATGPEAAAAVASFAKKNWPAATVAIGVGSAAVAAALLYRSRKK